MKRFVRLMGIFLIAAMLCGALTGCKAFDYRNAQKLCDKGEYLEASAIFSSLEDYKDSAEQANEAYRLYGIQLSENGNYEEATEIFKVCKVNETLKSTLDEISNSLASQGDYKNAYRFLYLHDTNEEWMQDFLYQYLNWQMDNHDYADTAETFSAIQGYQDTLTNDKFAGARLMAMGIVQWGEIEVDIWSGDSVLLLSLSFTDEQQLYFSVSGGTISFYTFEMTNQVYKYDSWDFYFDGKTIYVKDEGQFIKAGTIETFQSANGDKAESVTLSLDLPGMMTINSCDFEKA